MHSPRRSDGHQALISVKMYGPGAYMAGRGLSKVAHEDEEKKEEELQRQSPWPPRNAAPFNHLNSFMERLVLLLCLWCVCNPQSETLPSLHLDPV